MSQWVMPAGELLEMSSTVQEYPLAPIRGTPKLGKTFFWVPTTCQVG